MKDLKIRQETLRENEHTIILAEKRMQSLENMLAEIEDNMDLVNIKVQQGAHGGAFK